MRHFDIPPTMDMQAALRLIVDKMNDIYTKIDIINARAMRSVPQGSYVSCDCDVSYTGAHRYDCRYRK